MNIAVLNAIMTGAHVGAQTAIRASQRRRREEEERESKKVQPTYKSKELREKGK